MPLSWWNKDKLQDKLPFLQARNKVKTAIINWFLNQDYIEVETAQLQLSPGNEVHLLGLATQWTSPELKSHEMYFATSPEFSCKKLIAGGMNNIFEFARVFRNRDLSAIHSPEFTMLEFYRTNYDWLKIIEDSLEICKIAAIANNIDKYSFSNLEIPISNPPIYIKVKDAFIKFAGINLDEMLDETGNGIRDKFAFAAIKNDVEINDADDWSDIFTKILIAKIEPNLKNEAIYVLYEYPYPEGALAQRCKNNNKYVERFEIYICGLEIANGFGELIDNDEQRKRFEIAMKKQYEIYGKSYNIDNELLNAIGQMPPTSGVAIGFDRLIMIISGARNINDVLWTPFNLGE